MKKIAFVLSLIIASTLFVDLALGSGPLIQTSFSTNPATVAPGSDGYVQMNLKNIGTAVATSINVNSISTDSYITSFTSGIGSLGSLDNGESTSALFKFSVARNAPSGLYTIKFSMNYCADSSCTETDPTAIVSVQAPSALQVTSIEPSTLSAGQTTSLNFNLANNGADAINNIVLSWSAPSNEILPLGLSNTLFIPSLNGGVSLKIPVNVSVSSSVSPGVYPLIIKVEYFDKSGTKQDTTSSIGIKIGGTTNFDVVVQQESAGTTSLSIANIGVNPATSVSVAIPQQQNLVVSGASSVFLGTLNPGDFGVASFQISSRPATNIGRNATSVPTSSGTNVALEISYSDTSGERQVVQKQITLTPSTFATSGTVQRDRGLFSGITLYVIIGVIIVVIVFIVWFFKVRKRKKKSLEK
jgi:hypothetical protein